MKDIKVAFVHDWLVDKGGSENSLAAMLELWPEAPIYTLLHDPNTPCQSFLYGHQVHTSFLQKLPQATRRYRSFLPIMPIAIEQFDLSSYNVVISSSHAVAKGVITGPDQLHISYCYTPIRYAWDLQHQYLRESGKDKGLQSWVVRGILHEIRKWDCRTANGVDHFVAISNFIARRIWKVYRRESSVIYPPVDLDKFLICTNKEDYYLAASRLVPYKRIDLIVEAFSTMPNKSLIVVGDGPDFKKIQALAKPNVTVLGFQEFDALKDYMQRAKAFIFAAEEDFGIVSVEAQACGTPVIAYGKGGAVETIIDGKTGILFNHQTTDDIKTAVEMFEKDQALFKPKEIRQNAERFSKQRFKNEFQQLVENKIAVGLY